MADVPNLDRDIVEWFRRALFEACGAQETPMSERSKQLGDTIAWPLAVKAVKPGLSDADRRAS
jgi:hypothetical protein